jgi:hypothetical protein
MSCAARTWLVRSTADVRFAPNRRPPPAFDRGPRSAKLGRIGLRFLTPLVALRGIVFLRMLPSSVCFGENCDASET